MFQIEALDHVALHVQNLQQSLEWYQSVLGMEMRSHYQDTTGHGKPVVLGSGDACIALFPPNQRLQERLFRDILPCESHEPISSKRKSIYENSASILTLFTIPAVLRSTSTIPLAIKSS